MVALVLDQIAYQSRFFAKFVYERLISKPLIYGPS